MRVNRRDEKASRANRLAEAFALSTARAADLLALLGSFNVWEGDLSTMRGDNPHTPNPAGDGPEGPPTMRGFLDTLVLVRAIKLLQANCRAALAAAYAEHIEPVDAERLLINCEQRLLEIYDSLANDSPGEAASVP